jgi:hypothetical protein
MLSSLNVSEIWVFYGICLLGSSIVNRVEPAAVLLCIPPASSSPDPSLSNGRRRGTAVVWSAPQKECTDIWNTPYLSVVYSTVSVFDWQIAIQHNILYLCSEPETEVHNLNIDTSPQHRTSLSVYPHKQTIKR